MTQTIETAAREVSPATIHDAMQALKEHFYDQYQEVVGKIDILEGELAVLQVTRERLEDANDTLERYLNPPQTGTPS